MIETHIITSVDVSTVLSSHYQDFVSKSIQRDRNLVFIITLDNFEKNHKSKSKKSKDKDSDSDNSDSEMLTRSARRKLKEKSDLDNLLNHLDKGKDEDIAGSDSNHTTSDIAIKAAVNEDKIYSKDELMDIANEEAKNKLLESDDDDTDMPLVVNSSSRKETKNHKIKTTNEEESAKTSEKNSNKSDEEKKNEKGKWRNDKLLKMKISDSSDTEDENKITKMKEKLERSKLSNNDSDSDENSTPIIKVKKKKTRQRRLLDSDSDVQEIRSSSEDEYSSASTIEKSKNKEKAKKMKKRSKSSDSSSSEPRPKAKRRRIKKVDSDSNSSDDENVNSQGTPGKGRKNIRKVIKDKQVADDTKQAALLEEERLKRIAERQRLYHEMYETRLAGEAKVDKLVLDFDEKTKEELVRVDDELVKRLKPHQAQGIKFMWDACFESLEQIKNSKGSGCIIAHCMGLGKTFQVVTLAHTLLNNDKTGVKTIMIVCPLSTVLNWVNEFKMWLKHAKDGDDIEIFELTKMKKNQDRRWMLNNWKTTGGVLIIGYEMYRNLSSSGKKMKKAMQENILQCLVDPGPDVVVCDEGHLLKNEGSALSKAMKQIRTLRRIVLTGTPLQNNLIEYHCMVQFVKPNLLGTKKEFLNRFVNPISNGQYEDSTPYDVKLMKKRAHVLHKMLEGSVQRFDYSVLTPFLPPKQEYVIFVKLTDVQKKLYQYYLDNLSRRQKGVGGSLFADFQSLQRIWTHPIVMRYSAEKEEKDKERKRLEEEDTEGSLKDFIDDDSASGSDNQSVSSNNSHSTKSDDVPVRRPRTRATANGSDVESDPEPESQEPLWWEQFVEEKHYEDLTVSIKLKLLFAILKECEQIGDKVLVFSQSLYSLTLIEHFLAKIDDATQANKEMDTLDQHQGSWSLGLDYFRLDGSTSAENRNHWCKIFNRESNTRARLFLISTRAGGLGINLTAANRVIIFDASWNPSHDVQSIFRIYRFGQKKPCYIYRFLAMGTMEEKIYKRQVAKLSLACRVVDEQQIERHYSGHNLAELYSFDPGESEEEKTLNCPKDRLLAEIFLKFSSVVKDYLEHDSLLENKEEEELNEEERQQAWQEYEDEKKGKPVVNFGANFLGMGADSFSSNTDSLSDLSAYMNMYPQDFGKGSPMQQSMNSSQLLNTMYRNVDNSMFMNPGVNAHALHMQQNYPMSYVRQQQQRYENLLQNQMQYAQAYGNRVHTNAGPSYVRPSNIPNRIGSSNISSKNDDDVIEILPQEKTTTSSLQRDKANKEE